MPRTEYRSIKVSMFDIFTVEKPVYDFFLFLQLYIILIRPERNVRQSMMPMRYSHFQKGSGTTGSGTDMMAALMVTAATCDQKNQIQKYVPPIEADEGTLKIYVAR